MTRENKIHFKKAGDKWPICGIGFFKTGWSSMELSSSGQWTRVTCKRCLRYRV